MPMSSRRRERDEHERDEHERRDKPAKHMRGSQVIHAW